MMFILDLQIACLVCQMVISFAYSPQKHGGTEIHYDFRFSILKTAETQSFAKELFACLSALAVWFHKNRATNNEI